MIVFKMTGNVEQVVSTTAEAVAKMTDPSAIQPSPKEVEADPSAIQPSPKEVEADPSAIQPSLQEVEATQIQINYMYQLLKVHEVSQALASLDEAPSAEVQLEQQILPTKEDKEFTFSLLNDDKQTYTLVNDEPADSGGSDDVDCPREKFKSQLKLYGL